MEVLDAIKTRRSIRRYKATPVDDKTIELVLEAARYAPSWGNSQCWRFIVVRDSDVRNKLADAVIDISDRPNRAYEAIKNAPVTIVACAELGKSGYYYGREPKTQATDKGDWYMFDVALAMQNLTLAARSLGLGTLHVGAFNAKMAAGVLNVPEGFHVVEMVPLGYPDEEPAIRPRKELSELVFYDKWT